MKIKTLELENFKSAPNGVINLDSVNVLVGENGKGKTSIQNALRFILNGSLPDEPIHHGCDHLHVTAIMDDGCDTKMERVFYPSDTFRINNMSIKEKDFLKEVEKYRNLYEQNGAVPQIGPKSNPFFKTQSPDVIWNFLVTGKTDGFRVHGLKELELELEDGTILYMCKSQPSKVMINGKKTTNKTYTEYIGRSMNCDANALNLVTSSEVMSAMKMTDFAKYLISIIPVTIDFDKLSELAVLDDCEKGILKPLLPPSPATISITDIAEAYKTLYATRSELSRQLNEWKKRSVFEGQIPNYEEKQIREQISILNQQLGAASQIAKAWQIYDRNCKDRQRYIENLKQMISDYNKIGSVEKPNKEYYNYLVNEENSLRDHLHADTGIITRLRQANVPILKMLKDLDSTTCPLCDKLVCNTDKTSCKKDLETIIHNNEKLINEATLRYQENEQRLAACLNNHQVYQEKQSNFEKKYLLWQNIEQLKKSIPAEPEKPAQIPDTTKLQAELANLQEILTQVVLYQEAQKALGKYEETMMQYNLYCNLVKKTEPKKGLLTNTILSFILEPFKQHINAFIKEIWGDMEISFVMEETGLQVYCRAHSRADFVPVNALSTGEKMLVTIALMDMVSTISNSRILVFDCLESLDSNSFSSLMKLLTSPIMTNRYDHIILAAVNHSGIIEILENYKNLCNIIHV